MSAKMELKFTGMNEYIKRLEKMDKFPPALPLHPVIPDNACDLRFTAAAGT